MNRVKECGQVQIMVTYILLDFVKNWEHLDHMSDFQLPKRESAPLS
jgi:hypothetical protein